MNRFTVAALITLMSTGAQAATLDVNVNRENLRMAFDKPVSVLDHDVNMSVGGHYHKEDGDDAAIVSGGLHTWEVNETYSLGVGIKGYYADADQYDGGAVAVGVQGRVAVPQLPGVQLGGHAYSAPTIATFSDIDGLIDITVRAYYQALEDVDLYVGWSKLNLDREDQPSMGLDSRLNLGMTLSF